MTYAKQLTRLQNKAVATIEKIMRDKKQIEFASARDIQTGEAEVSDFPDFLHYEDAQGWRGWANITKLYFDQHSIISFDAILKDTGEDVTAHIHELEAQDILRLADYLKEFINA